MFCTVWHLPATLCRLGSSAAVSWSESEPSATKAVPGTDGSLTVFTRRLHNNNNNRPTLYSLYSGSAVCCCVTASWAALRGSERRLLDTNPRLTVTDAERSELGVDEIIRNHELFDYGMLFEKKRPCCDRTGLPSSLVWEWRPTPPAPAVDLWPLRLPSASTYCFVRRKPFTVDRWEIRNR